MGNLTDAAGLSLVADIGGTNTRVALARGPVVDRATVMRHANADHPDLASVLAQYLAQSDIAADQKGPATRLGIDDPRNALPCDRIAAAQSSLAQTADGQIDTGARHVLDPGLKLG